MVIISYDIESNKLRNKLAKFIKKFGFRLQYSVYEIVNSERVLNNIISELTNNFENKFSQADSVIIFQLSNSCKITRFGFAKNIETNFIIVE